jgi:anti-anti-sigma factor
MWISEEDRTAVAHADASLTFSNRHELARLAADAVARGARNVVVDLSDTEYVDTAALGTLGTLAHHVSLRGGTFRLANVRPEIASALAAVRLDRFLPVHVAGAGRAD